MRGGQKASNTSKVQSKGCLSKTKAAGNQKDKKAKKKNKRYSFQNLPVPLGKTDSVYSVKERALYIRETARSDITCDFRCLFFTKCKGKKMPATAHSLITTPQI